MSNASDQSVLRNVITVANLTVTLSSITPGVSQEEGIPSRDMAGGSSRDSHFTLGATVEVLVMSTRRRG